MVKNKTKKNSQTKKKPKKSDVCRHKQTKQKIKRQIKAKRPIHKKILLHPLFVMVLLCVMVILYMITFRAAADTEYMTVTASVPVQPLSSAAVITSPLNNATFDTNVITVEGICPDQSYIKLYDNGSFSGVAWCGKDNTFSISTSIVLGANVLSVQDYNEVNKPGPLSSTINVNYAPKTVLPTTPTNTLQIVSSYTYQANKPGITITFPISVKGGNPPYLLKISWGDNTHSTKTTKNNLSFDIEHTYYNTGYYVIGVSATDKSGLNASLQLIALVKNKGKFGNYLPGLTTGSGSLGQAGSSLYSIFDNLPIWLKVAWPTLLIIIIMLTSYILGERHEYRIMVRRHHNRYHHAM